MAEKIVSIGEGLLSCYTPESAVGSLLVLHLEKNDVSASSHPCPLIRF